MGQDVKNMPEMETATLDPSYGKKIELLSTEFGLTHSEVMEWSLDLLMLKLTNVALALDDETLSEDSN